MCPTNLPGGLIVRWPLTSLLQRPRRTSGGGQASDAAAAKQQGKPKSPSTTAAGKRATKQRPAKKLAANAGRGARKQTAVRKDKVGRLVLCRPRRTRMHAQTLANCMLVPHGCEPAE